MNLEQTLLVSPALKSSLTWLTSQLKCLRTCMFEARVARSKSEMIWVMLFINRLIITYLDNKLVNMSIQSATGEEYKIQQLMGILTEKEGLIQQLIDRCEKQEKRLTKFIIEQGQEKAKKIPFSLFKPFLLMKNEKNGEEGIICFRIKGKSLNDKEPIWVSSNMQMISAQSYSSNCRLDREENQQYSQIGIQKSESICNESKYELQLTKDVQKLKENIGKCESLIVNWKQLKEMELIENAQQQRRCTPERSKEQTFQVASLKKENKDLESELFKLTATNQKLREKVGNLEQAEAHYLTVIKQLEQKVSSSKINFSSLQKSRLDDKQKKEKRSKIVLLNYG